MKRKIINWAEPFLDNKEEKNILKALKTTWISDGAFVKRFEKDVSKYVNSKFSISVNNGTSAIHLVYLALKCIYRLRA